MQKIIVTNKMELSSIEDAFSPIERSAVWRALNFKINSLRASLIRCFTMNFLSSSEYLTTNH